MTQDQEVTKTDPTPVQAEEEGWDPANLAATIVLVIVGIGLLFWLFWALMVAKSLTANIVAGVILLILIGETVYIFKK
jgi:hypothetical protein